MLPDIEKVKQAAQRNFLREGCLQPVILTQIDGQNAIIPGMFTNYEEKVGFVDAIKQMIVFGKIKEFVFIAESWMAPATGVKVQSLADHPEKKEIIVIQHSSPKMDKFEKCEIIRNEDGSIDFSEWESWECKPRFDDQSLMQGLFLKASVQNN